MKYSLRSKDKFKVNFVRTSLKSRTISVFGVKVYNKLAINIVEAKHELHFKALCKKSLLNKYIK